MCGDEIPTDDGPLTPEEEAMVARLSDSELQEIDEALISHTTRQWRKVAMVVGTTMSSLPNRVPGIPDVFYAMRVRKLVEDGVLESQGNLARMRFSEVRLRPLTGSREAT
jgi:hypothetical protein